MINLIRSPTLQFILAGCVLYGLYALVPRQIGERTIRIDEAIIMPIRSDLTAIFGRDPTGEELNSAVRDYIEKEVLFREALALGLHRSDPMVRQLLIDSVETLNDQTIVWSDPTEVELRELWSRTQEDYEKPRRVSFGHILLTDEQIGSLPSARALELLTLLQSGTDPKSLPYGTNINHSAIAQSESDIAIAYGPYFARSVMALMAQSWSGPIESNIGYHLVLIDEILPPESPNFEQQRDAVEQEWRRRRTAQANEGRIDNLVASYRIEVAPGLADFDLAVD